MADNPFYRYLDSVGNGTGTKNMAAPADSYYLEAQPGENLYLERLIIAYQDAGGGTMQEYGNLNAALATGIVVNLHVGEDSIDLTDGVPIVDNGGWARQCYDVQRLDWGSGEDLFVCRWTFSKAGLPLHLRAGDRLEMQVQDSLAGLSNHYAMVQGYDTR